MDDASPKATNLKAGYPRIMVSAALGSTMGPLCPFPLVWPCRRKATGPRDHMSGERTRESLLGKYKAMRVGPVKPCFQVV